MLSLSSAVNVLGGVASFFAAGAGGGFDTTTVEPGAATMSPGVVVGVVPFLSVLAGGGDCTTTVEPGDATTVPGVGVPVWARADAPHSEARRRTVATRREGKGATGRGQVKIMSAP
jgi:hypothetical protein